MNFKFGTKVEGICEDSNIVECILIQYDTSDNNLQYAVAVNEKDNKYIGKVIWVKSIRYIY